MTIGPVLILHRRLWWFAVCGSKAEAHHEDYAKPLEVRWLCRRHHMREHAGWIA